MELCCYCSQTYQRYSLLRRKFHQSSRPQSHRRVFTLSFFLGFFLNFTICFQFVDSFLFLFCFHPGNALASRFTCLLLMACRYTQSIFTRTFFDFELDRWIFELNPSILNSIILLEHVVTFHVLNFGWLCNRMDFLFAVYIGCAIIWKNCYTWAFSPSCENKASLFLGCYIIFSFVCIY